MTSYNISFPKIISQYLVCAHQFHTNKKTGKVKLNLIFTFRI